MNTMLTKKEFWSQYLENCQQVADVKLITGDGCSMSTHSLLLALGSDFMRNILLDIPPSDFQSVVLLPDFSSTEVEHLFNFILTEDVGDSIALLETLGVSIFKDELKHEYDDSKDSLEPLQYMYSENNDTLDIKCEPKYEVTDSSYDSLEKRHKSDYRTSKKSTKLRQEQEETRQKKLEYVEETDDSYICKICQRCYGKGIKGKKGIMEHVGNTHKVGAKLKCEVCFKIFYYTIPYQKHMLSHSTEKGYVCETCGKSFKAQLSLDFHNIKIHAKGIKENTQFPFCEICKKYCVSKMDFHEHQERHSGVKKYPCFVCSKMFFTKRVLDIHIKNSHMGREKPPLTESRRKIIRESSRRRREKIKAETGRTRTEKEMQYNREYARKYNAKKREMEMNNEVISNLDITDAPFSNSALLGLSEQNN